ncbi:hypothetical protein D9M68_856490 [compost metagenome]
MLVQPRHTLFQLCLTLSDFIGTALLVLRRQASQLHTQARQLNAIWIAQPLLQASAQYRAIKTELLFLQDHHLTGKQAIDGS